LGNDQSIRLWEDTWLGETLLSEQYPMLYIVVCQRNILVAYVLANNPLSVEFRRILSDNKWDAWNNLVQRLMSINLNNNDDKFV
jgi:hypothetical protein